MKILLDVIRQNLIEFSRDKLIHVLVGLMLVFLLSTQIISDLALSQREYVILSLGQFGLEIAGIFLLLMAALGLHKEIKKRTLLSILTKPLSRSQFYLGKFLAINIVLAVMLALGWIVIQGILLLNQSQLGYGFEPVLLLGFELSMLSSLALLCAFLTSPGLSIFFVLGFWSCGKLGADLAQQVEIGQKIGGATPGWLANFSKMMYWIFPDLGKFDLSGVIVTARMVDVSLLISPVAVGLGYTLFFLGLALWRFERKDFS